jgi:hypothetical protein
LDKEVGVVGLEIVVGLELPGDDFGDDLGSLEEVSVPNHKGHLAIFLSQSVHFLFYNYQTSNHCLSLSLHQNKIAIDGPTLR